MVLVESLFVFVGKYIILDVINEGGIFIIKFNRLSKKNVINFEVFEFFI